MDKIYHYTSLENWTHIRGDGVLLPKSNPNVTTLELPAKAKSLVRRKWIFWKNQRYVVGLPERFSRNWFEYGLMESLMRRTTGQVILEVPIIDANGAFVRDNLTISPRWCNERFGEDVAGRFAQGWYNPSDSRVREAYRLYLESTRPLSEYQGEYVLPEIWLPQKTPVNLLGRLGLTRTELRVINGYETLDALDHAGRESCITSFKDFHC